MPSLKRSTTVSVIGPVASIVQRSIRIFGVAGSSLKESTPRTGDMNSGAGRAMSGVGERIRIELQCCSVQSDDATNQN